MILNISMGKGWDHNQGHMFGSFQLGELGWIDSVFRGSYRFNVLSFLWNSSVAPIAKSMCQTKPETFKGFIEFYMHLWRSVVFIIKPQKKWD